ncbi:phage major capsid protein [Nafulsella turpanensis]|uniref:phage major capsid protein n=1 Tax=Nafulsella turpanensis TaxID=1265690 RepID=UPI000348C00D|nr:phage major capsid protein [Nafulsella turpanensis]
MNKRVNELKEQRANKIKELTSITEKAEQEKRFKNPEELEKWDAIKQLIEELDAEISTVEEEERFNLTLLKGDMKKEVETKEQKEVRKYDISKAVSGFLNGKLEGFEAEMHQEGVNQMRSHGHTASGLVIPEQVKRSFTAAGQSGHIQQLSELSGAAVEGGILEKLGVTVYNNASANIALNFSKGLNAGIYEEGVAVSESTYAEKTAVLSAKRIQGWKNFSRSYLAQTATMPDFLAQMERAIEKAVSEDIIKKIVGDSYMTLTGRDEAAAGAVLVWKDLMKLKAGVEVDDIVNGRFIAGKELYNELKSISKDTGSGRFILEGDVIDGDQAVNGGTKVPFVPATTGTTPTAAKYKLIYGDFKEAYAAYFSGATEILMDPFTASNSGNIKVTFLRMGSTAVNPYAFRSIQNVNL